MIVNSNNNHVNVISQNFMAESQSFNNYASVCNNRNVNELIKEECLNKKENEYDPKELDKSLKKLNRFLEDENTHAEYSRHEDLGTLMIKIINDDTNDIILEVPPKKILDMVASLCKSVGLLDKKA